jgi:hypothetical protein
MGKILTEASSGWVAKLTLVSAACFTACVILFFTQLDDWAKDAFDFDGPTIFSEQPQQPYENPDLEQPTFDFAAFMNLMERYTVVAARVPIKTQDATDSLKELLEDLISCRPSLYDHIWHVEHYYRHSLPPKVWRKLKHHATALESAIREIRHRIDPLAALAEDENEDFIPSSQNLNAPPS